LIREYVVDASVILKWVLGAEDEPDQGKAMELLQAWARGNIAISAPVLWEFEVGNILGRAVPEEASEKMGIIMDLNIRGIPLTHQMCKSCFDVMKTRGVTFYDASYLASAYAVNATLVTANERFIKKIGEDDHLRSLNNIDI